jgi:RNA 3'-terminal phosphate cyclase (ATP)
MIKIDGSQGEGGGQVLRTSLSLSLCLKQPVRITNIRKSRRNPGLAKQHVVAINAAAAIGRAVVRGVEIGSQEITFIPSAIVAGDYRFDIGTAGSTTLVLQTILPALLIAESSSFLVLYGGTHNPMAPSYEFMEKAFLPILNRMGGKVSLSLERAGFYPKGGGRISVKIEPSRKLQSISLQKRGKIIHVSAVAMLAHLPEHIAHRELDVLKARLHLDDNVLKVGSRNDAFGPGNAVSVFVESEFVSEVFTAFGQKGKPAEKVAEELADEVEQYLAADVPVGQHLADQLLLPFALAGGGNFCTMKPTLHTETNIKVIQRFLDISINMQKLSPGIWLIEVG